MNTGACATKPPRPPARQQFEDNQSLASLRRAGPKQNLKPLALIPRPSSAKRAVLGQEPPGPKTAPDLQGAPSPRGFPGAKYRIATGTTILRCPGCGGTPVRIRISRGKCYLFEIRQRLK